MGVPKFFRWLSERYPKICQRQTFLVNPETHQRYFPNQDIDPPLMSPDPLSLCGLPPEIDRLYIDCNGVIHGCSHNNGNATGMTHKQIFRNVCYYLDRVISDIAKPQELVYLAIDGVAPRAKLNQQRARRYRGGSEELEQSLYEEYYEQADDDDEELIGINDTKHATGKFESTDENDIDIKDGTFHPSSITPGTEFFQACTQHLEHWIQYKLSTDPNWKHLRIILSGPNVPGEGEHKIMEFMRQERARPDYNPNLRHAIMGQDADLIMLGLVTHEPNLCILRERIVFDSKKRAIIAAMGIDVYYNNCHFEWLHMRVLRDYLMYEFETAPAVVDSPFDLERTIDDFVFLTFFVGNDFLPHMPALDIGDDAFDLLFYNYKVERHKWKKSLKLKKMQGPYLTNSGEIICGQRLEGFLQALGSYEVDYYNDKRQSESSERQRFRKLESKYGIQSTLPSDEILLSKEEADRARYRDMMKSINPLRTSSFEPVLTNKQLSTARVVFQPEEEALEAGFISRIGSLLQNSITGEVQSKQENRENFALKFQDVNDQDLKGRYYYDKFKFSPFDKEKHQALRKAYVEGLVWNLRYYYKGCASWSWYYPYHYGPMLSDLIDLSSLLKAVDFEGDNVGKPLEPFQQLMGCLPPSSSYLLPEPYRWLMKDENSPLAQFYPRSFIVDMNGKRWPWEATVLLPFLDSKLMVEAISKHVTDTMLTDDEKARNQTKNAILYSHDAEKKIVVPPIPLADELCFLEFESNVNQEVHVLPSSNAVFQSKVLEGTDTIRPGFPSLSTAPIESLWRRRIGVNVHGSQSRYRTAILQTSQSLPNMPPVEALASALIGTLIFINYPYLTEGFVTALTSVDMTIRGRERPQYHDEGGRDLWMHKTAKLLRRQEYGYGYGAPGGWKVPMSTCLITVRPLQQIVTLPDGTNAKKFAKFEVTLPLTAALWSPLAPDPRTANIPLLLEPDPFFSELASGGFSAKPKSKALSVQNSVGAPKGPSANVQTHLLSAMDATSDKASLADNRAFSTASRVLQSPRPLSRVEKRSLHTMARHHYHRSPALTSRGSGKGAILGFGVTALVFFGGAMGGAHARNSYNAFQSRGVLLGHDLDEPMGATSITPRLEFEHGTTTLSFVFEHGIVAAVDSRASLGNFVGSKTVQKVLPINSHMIGTMAGGAADCSFWIRKLKGEAELFELKYGYRMSVVRASRLLSNALYENRESDLSIGTMIMGFDPFDGGPRIFYVDNTGARIEGEMFSVGSGSTFALGVLDQERRFNMTTEEAIALGIKAIRHATFRDAYSGGFINVYLITQNGWKKVFSEDLASSVDMVRREQVEPLPQDQHDSKLNSG